VQIADELRPNAMMVSLLSALSRIIPTWKIIPTVDIVDIAFKLPQVREQVYIYIYYIFTNHIINLNVNTLVHILFGHVSVNILKCVAHSHICLNI
jgi:hypothetical protein